MLTGVYAARNLAGGDYDVWSVNTEMEYLEEGGIREATNGDRLVPTAANGTGEMAAFSPEKVIEAAFARLDPVALGTAFGVVGAFGLFFATVVLLIEGGPRLGENLALLGQYFLGFEVTWRGATLGFAQAGIGGFALGYLVAGLRNWGLAAYAYLLRRRAASEASRDVLGQV
jgi:hypothetical protein